MDMFSSNLMDMYWWYRDGAGNNRWGEL